MKNKEMKVKAMSMAVAMSMVVGLCPSTIFAATGSQTAKDGTYTKTAHVARTAEDDENEDEWNEYDAEGGGWQVFSHHCDSRGRI